MATEFATTEFTNAGGDAHGTCSVIDAGRGRHFFSGASSHAGLVLLANNGEQTLGIINTVTNQLVATIAESGTTGHEVGHHPMGNWRLFRFTETLGSGEPRSKAFGPAFNARVG
jgi:hypothetical protein